MVQEEEAEGETEGGRLAARAVVGGTRLYMFKSVNETQLTGG